MEKREGSNEQNRRRRVSISLDIAFSTQCFLWIRRFVFRLWLIRCFGVFVKWRCTLCLMFWCSFLGFFVEMNDMSFLRFHIRAMVLRSFGAFLFSDTCLSLRFLDAVGWLVVFEWDTCVPHFFYGVYHYVCILLMICCVYGVKI